MRWLTGIIIPSGYENIEDGGRKRLFVLFLLLIVVPLIAFGTIHVINGVYRFGIIDLAAAAVLFGIILSVRCLENSLNAYRFVIILMMALFAFWVKTGAVDGHATLWVLAFPLFSFFLTGRREGLTWTAIMFWVTIYLFINPFSLLIVWSYPPTYILRHSIAYLVIVLFTYTYELYNERYRDTIGNERSLLVKEKENLADAMREVEAVNARLREEMEVRRITEDELRRHRDNLEGLVIERTRELWRYNRELEKSEKRYRLLADNITDMIWYFDMNFKVQYISPSVWAMFGYTIDEAMALTINDFNAPESIEKIKKAFQEQLEIEARGDADPKRFIVLQVKHRRKGGSVFDAEVKASFMRDESGKPVGIVGMTRDISERVKAEKEKEKMKEQLAQAQKMEAIGTLVGGLAHDFNNILSGIQGSFDLLGLLLKKETLSDRDTIEKYLSVGIESTRRSVDIIRNLLALSSKHELRLAPIDVNEAVRQTLELCKNSFPKSVILDFNYSPERPLIMGDMAQIGQVLLNLCINASHAMTIMRGQGEQQGGLLSLQVDITGPDSLVDGGKGTAPDDGMRWVRIGVSDTGVGMDRETMDRIFEPFFSRKERDKGSGLGLAMSYNIIQNHRGIIRVYSEPGKGSRFTLFFPLCEERRASNRAAFPQKEGDLVRGTGTILVIDDERMVLNVTRGFLEQCGYSVLTANTPGDGIRIFGDRHAEIAGIIIDLSMQGMSGIDVFIELKKIDPGVRAVLSSGMLDAASKDRALALGFREFVNKPYLARELSIIVSNLLSG